VSDRSPRGDLVAIATLAVAMAAHQIAETARDALFLRELGPTRLPSVYLVLALIGIPIALLPARFRSSRFWLSAVLFLNAAVSAAFWWMTKREMPVYEALYVWTGLSATVFVTFFWLFLSGRHSVSRAKSVFPKIAMGGIVGALLGAMIARGITGLGSTRGLLLASAVLQIAGGILAIGLGRIGDLERVPAAKRAVTLAAMFKRAARSRYARTVGLMLLLASVTLTLVDYTFKSVVAEHVAKRDLARMFATFYAVLNLFSLLSMGLLARRLLVWVGLTSVMLFLPVLIVMGGAGVLLGGGLGAALLLKGADGSLRYSLHRTSTELLFVPMREATRSLVKPLLDIAIKPLGQGIASLLILLFLQLSTRNSVYAVMTVVFGLLWIGSGVRLRTLYLDVFRRTLRSDSVDIRAELPELKVESLATVVEQLNDENDGAVCGAMDLLAAHGHSALIPDLVLYHPSADVVTHAIKLFRDERRSRVRSLVMRSIDHASPKVRAESLLFLASIDRNFTCPARIARDPDPMVRGVAAALSLQAASDPYIGRQLGRGDQPDQEPFEVGFAAAIAYLPERARSCLDIDLIAGASPKVQGKIAEAIARAPREGDLPLLLHFLSIRHAREHARRALVALGNPALQELVSALLDEGTPLALRCHIPRTISRFPPQDAAPILLDCVATESDELVQHKALRGLGRLVASHPEISMDRERLVNACEQMIAKALPLMQIRIALERSTTDTTLLGLVRDAEQRSVEHVFRALHLLHPTEKMEHLFRSIFSGDVKRRANAEELLMHLVDRNLRDPLTALISSDPDLDPIEESTALELLLDDDGVLGRAALRHLELSRARPMEVTG
jgi:AAA family ATP:ADP antiporter